MGRGMWIAVLLASVVAPFISSCSKVRSCKSGTVFLTVNLGGSSLEADQLALTKVVDGRSETKLAVYRAGDVEETFEIRFDSGYPAGRFMSLDVVASRNGRSVGAGHAEATLANVCDTLTVAIAPLDLGSPPAVDLTPPCPVDICCRKANDCTSGVCLETGKCADVTELVYVNADTCMMKMPDGSAAAPICEVADALPLIGVNGKRVVKIAGAMLAYVKPISIPGKDVTLSGPGREAVLTARLRVIGSSAITIDPNSTVVIDGLTISEAGNDGITCSSNSKVIVQRTKVNGNHQAGINAGSCAVTVDSSWFENNRYGALRFGPGARYLVTNNFAINNGVSAPAVTIDPTASGTFAFNTLANNYGPSFGAVDCGMGATPKIIERCIVFNNGSRPGPTQFQGDCELVDTITGRDDIVTGAVRVDPMLDGSTFQLLPPPNPAIDRVLLGASGLLPDHDGNGRPRPAGKGWDVGADEYQP